MEPAASWPEGSLPAGVTVSRIRLLEGRPGREVKHLALLVIKNKSTLTSSAENGFLKCISQEGLTLTQHSKSGLTQLEAYFEAQSREGAFKGPGLLYFSWLHHLLGILRLPLGLSPILGAKSMEDCTGVG